MVGVDLWITAGLVTLMAILGTISIVLSWEAYQDRRRRKSFTKQLEKLDFESRPENAAAGLFRKVPGSAEGGILGSLTAHVAKLRDIEILIEQAAMTWTVQSFIVLSVGFGLALGGGAALAMRGVLPGIVGFSIGAALPYFYLRHRREKRIRAFEDQLPEAIDLLGRALRAGHPLSSGLRMVAEESPEPIAGEFRRVFEEQRFGLGMDESLLGMADRIPLMDVRIFVTAVLIQREVGGNLAEILDGLSHVIRQRFSILRQLRTYTAQGRMSGYILGGLPIFLGFVLFLINREDMIAFIVHPMGRIMMVVAVVLQLAGYFWISRIVKIEV